MRSVLTAPGAIKMKVLLGVIGMFIMLRALIPMATILGIRISIERNMFVAEQFMQSLIRRYGKHNISTDGGTWYPQACKFLNVKRYNHSSSEKSFIERTIKYIKCGTECFDDYFSCKKDNNSCKLKHVMNWLDNREIMEKNIR